MRCGHSARLCLELVGLDDEDDGAAFGMHGACCMARKTREPVDDLIDALVWMRRKAKKRGPRG